MCSSAQGLNGVSQVTASCELELESAEGPTVPVIQGALLTGLAVDAGCHGAFSWD